MKGGEIATNRPVVIKNHPFMALKNGACVKMDIPRPTNEVLKVAQSEVGTMTGRKYWRWYFGTRFINRDRTPWCGCFTAWCYNKADQYNKISTARKYGNLGYVPSYSRWANSYRKWLNPKYAQGGEIIVFGNDRHVGIVERVYNGYIFTIEGNASPISTSGNKNLGEVARRVYALNDPDIKGVIRP